MRKIVFQFVAIVLTLFVITSCNSDEKKEKEVENNKIEKKNEIDKNENIVVDKKNIKEKDIVGEWEIKDAQLINIDELVEEMASTFGLGEEETLEMKEEMQTGMSEEFVETILEFKNDKTFIAPDSEGTWSYDSDNKTIHISENNLSYEMEIINSKKNNLELIMTFNDSGMEFKISMTLARK